WKKDEIRFSLSGNMTNVDIYSHYYILRKKQLISINPILIPRYLEDNLEKFSGEEYDKSSDTQLKQGSTLLSRVNIGDRESVLD
ncbi:hypothetical protein, partial [Pseudomonas sp. 2822-17]|uniref:hypothetical protein n=1 Tax=Pseudomonas sp. 2822-17 TaxID=1712678 RepID=UPI001C48424C